MKRLTEYGLNTAYKVMPLYAGSETHLVDFGSEEPRRLIHEDNDGFYVNFKGKRMHFDEKMTRLLKAAGVKAINEPY